MFGPFELKIGDFSRGWRNANISIVESGLTIEVRSLVVLRREIGKYPSGTGQLKSNLFELGEQTQLLSNRFGNSDKSVKDDVPHCHAPKARRKG